jgi:hydrogenase maturation protein HypF
MTKASLRKRIEIRGVVQSVGFRPFVYRAAAGAGVHGYVLNSSTGVIIEAEGGESAVGRFLHTLQHDLPPLARIDDIAIADIEPAGDRDFQIRHSEANPFAFAWVPPDIATCPECLAEILDPGDRRYGYPFTNCTNCGPRYTIIRNIPYDRAETTMRRFRMCPRCQSEYEDPANRRFHAEPNACPDCGPSLWLISRGESLGHPLTRVRFLLAQGEIVAIKGLGGFHLACDAANEDAVALLRERKRRSGKAFAVMARDLAAAERLCEVTSADRALLANPRRPIVLMRRRAGAQVSGQVAPGTATLGVMLPYTPLHHLLFAESPGFETLVMTSGNLSEEPIVSGNEEAQSRLANLAEHFLVHDRDIQTRVDDSVVQAFEGNEYPVRRSRGFAAEPIDLGMPVAQILACGGELKNTVCLTKDHYAILSQHIGDLENLETMELFRETLGHLQRFFRVSPGVVAHDVHPNYMSTRFALEESGLRPIGVQHHHAHIASCMADNGIRGQVIGVALDGTGYGTDGKIWGGEFLLCGFGGFQRRGHIAYVPLPGGDRAVREPWRSALSYLRATFGSVPGLRLPLFDAIPRARTSIVNAMLERQIQTIDTSSCGRLFDAVASILGVRHEISYEGQAAIELEMLASDAAGVYPFTLAASDAGGGDSFQIDLRQTVEVIVHEFLQGVPPPDIASRFHRTVARLAGDACVRIRETDGLNRVCLSGGVFQNLRLLRLTADELRRRQFDVFLHRRVPPNDGGLALGQAVIANAIIAQ